MNADLTFVAPTHPVSENAVRGRHWATTRASLSPWQDTAWVHAHNARVKALKAITRRTKTDHTAVPITVQVVIPFRDQRRRDPHNYVGTVVKSIVDGLVRAKIVPDDNAYWVTVLEPELAVVPAPDPLNVTVRIRPRNRK